MVGMQRGEILLATFDSVKLHMGSLAGLQDVLHSLTSLL
jgi:hypothetical protein